MTDLQIKRNDALKRVKAIDQQIIVLAEILHNLTIDLNDAIDVYNSCVIDVKLAEADKS